jgi:hypothetical protein
MSSFMFTDSVSLSAEYLLSSSVFTIFHLAFTYFLILISVYCSAYVSLFNDLSENSSVCTVMNFHCLVVTRVLIEVQSSFMDRRYFHPLVIHLLFSDTLFSILVRKLHLKILKKFRNVLNV